MRERRPGSGPFVGTRVSRILSLWLFVSLLLATSCAQTPQVNPETNTNETVVSSTPPFQTKEPERYRATRTITTVTDTGETLVTQNQIARDGERRREEHEVKGLRVVYIELPEGRVVLLPDEKQFADMGIPDSVVAEANEYSDTSPLHLLQTDPLDSTYQRIGAETVNGRSTQKYRVVVNSSANANVSVSETVIWVDDALQMPIKSETRSSSGARSTMELTEIALDVDQGLFRLPEGSVKISFGELMKRLELD